MALNEKDADPDPFRQFHGWLNQAVEAGVEDASAMALSTVDASGSPSSRMVLLKELDSVGFVFFTNYKSRKGIELEGNSRVSLLFFWRELVRQIRISGTCYRISQKESAAYFHSRPLESRISAVISPQSQPVPNRQWLDSRWREYKEIPGGGQPAIPDSWGGYRVKPYEFEFFQGRPHRLHDRIRYRRQKREWIIDRLAP